MQASHSFHNHPGSSNNLIELAHKNKSGIFPPSMIQSDINKINDDVITYIDLYNFKT